MQTLETHFYSPDYLTTYSPPNPGWNGVGDRWPVADPAFELICYFQNNGYWPTKKVKLCSKEEGCTPCAPS